MKAKRQVKGKSNSKSNLGGQKPVPTLEVCINLEVRMAEAFKHQDDTLTFNLAEESVDDVLAYIRPILKRGDLESAFISLDRSAISQEEWDSMGGERDFFDSYLVK